MSDLNKLNLRFTNNGLLLVQDQTLIPFGHYAILDNLVTNFEGELTGRLGMTNQANNTTTGNVNGFRRLNDPTHAKSTFIVRDDQGILYATEDGSSHATTTPPFAFTQLTTGLSTSYGSFFMYRANLSNQTWCYVGDTTKMWKATIGASGALVSNPVGIYQPTGALVYPAAYTTGTVTTVMGSPNVTGSGTTWTSAMTGLAVVITDSGSVVRTGYYIQSVTDATHLVMTANWAPSSGSGLSYSIQTENAETGTHLTFNGTYTWIYTLYDSNTGTESLYNTVQGGATDPAIPTNVWNAFAIVIPTQTVPSSVTHARIYRQATAAPATPLDGLWHRVGQIPYTGTQAVFIDDIADSVAATADTVNLVSDQPFTTILTGTYSVTNGSNAVTGSGTTWTSALNGKIMNILGVEYIISTVNSTTSITLETNYSGITQSNISGLTIAGQSLPYLFGPVNGYMLACGDPNNPGYVYWTDVFSPDTQNPANNVEVSTPADPTQAGLIYNGVAYVFTKETLWQLVQGVSLTNVWTPFPTACGHGLFAPHAFAVGAEIYFLSKDGLYATSGGVERSLIDDSIRPLFRGLSVNGYFPIDFTQPQAMFMTLWQNHVILQYQDTNGATNILLFNLIYKRWSIWNLRLGTNVLYTDEETSSRLLFGTNNPGSLYLYSGTTDGSSGLNTIPTHLLTGFITLDAPLIHKEWNGVIFDINPNSMNVTVTAYINKGGTQLAQAVWNDSGRSRKVLNFISNTDANFAEDLQLDVQWAANSTPPILYGYELLYRPDVTQLTEWVCINENHGIQGWQILRSLYITLRTDGTVTLAITPDNGTTQTYTVTTGTSGLKQKIFLPLNPTKGKLFKYVLSIAGGATYFRLYPEDCEAHVKPWVSALGYRIANPFMGGDAVMGGTSQQNPAQTGFLAGAGQALQVR